MIVSAPIVGGKYFTHTGLMGEFGARGFRLLEQRNIYFRQSGVARPIDLTIRFSRILALLDWLPDTLIYRRCYVMQV